MKGYEVRIFNSKNFEEVKEISELQKDVIKYILEQTKQCDKNVILMDMNKILKALKIKENEYNQELTLELIKETIKEIFYFVVNYKTKDNSCDGNSKSITSIHEGKDFKIGLDKENLMEVIELLNIDLSK